MQLIFNFCLVYSMRKVQVNQEELKMHDTHQLLVWANELINLTGEKVHDVRKKRKDVLLAECEVGLEINAVKTK